MLSQLKKSFHFFGLDIRRYNPLYVPELSLAKLLKHHNINLFLDVGANTGQTALSLIENGYQEKIISFEPLSSAYNTLLRNSKRYKNWAVAERCAIGEKNGEIEINIAANSQSSSVLPMLKTHLKAAPESKFIGKEKAKIFKLDTIVPKYLRSKDKAFLKIDVQGYEEKVLKGIKKIWPKILGLQVELSLVPLYKGEPTFDKMLNKLTSLGFSLYQLYPGFVDRKSGRLLQLDGVFLKKEK